MEHASYLRRICNLTLKMQKLVTHFSLRLGLELLGKENCIEFHPILSDCKRRNPQNLAGSVPNVPTSANILIQKKEQKSLLLEFVIDFASLVFHCVGSAIYVYQSGIGYFADLRLLRLTPFPWNPRQCATRKLYFVRYLLLFLNIVSCKPDNAQKNKSHSFEWLSCCALRS